ncbi:MAG: hypothetical protein ACYS5V_00560, partial [Planctomycetota bacterium]
MTDQPPRESEKRRAKRMVQACREPTTGEAQPDPLQNAIKRLYEKAMGDESLLALVSVIAIEVGRLRTRPVGEPVAWKHCPECGGALWPRVVDSLVDESQRECRRCNRVYTSPFLQVTEEMKQAALNG